MTVARSFLLPKRDGLRQFAPRLAALRWSACEFALISEASWRVKLRRLSAQVGSDFGHSDIRRLEATATGKSIPDRIFFTISAFLGFPHFCLKDRWESRVLTCGKHGTQRDDEHHSKHSS